MMMAMGLWPVAAAWAQESEVARAPEQGMAIPMTIVVVLSLGLLVASFTSSRRGHQD